MLSIFDDQNILYPTISYILFGIILIFNITINNIQSNWFNTTLDFYFFNISKDLCLFYSIYIIWWIVLLYLSFTSDEVLVGLGSFICLNIGFSLLPITRNSLWITTMNFSYNKLINIHKFISVLTLISAVIKVIAVVVLYNNYRLVSTFSNKMGLVATIGIIVSSLIANPLIRKYWFELFYYTHRILSVLIIVTMTLHFEICIYYVSPALILYFMDLIIRLFNINKVIYTKIENVEFKDKNNTCYTFITLSTVKKINTKPGCYFFLSCTDISKFEWHPLSLISKSNNTLVFCIKNMGKKSWSDKIKQFSDNEFIYKTINLYLQGPYLHVKPDYMSNNYEYIINIANGIGITPFFTISEDIANNMKINKLTSIKKVLFIWIVEDITFLLPFLHKLETLNDMGIDIKIFVTKVNMNNKIDDKYYLIFEIKTYRPNLIDYINNFIVENNVSNKKICIISCGSTSLVNDIYKVTSKLNIKLFNETFN
jgi:NAD(P)H-flavin reductase